MTVITRRQWLQAVAVAPAISSAQSAIQKVVLFNGRNFDGWTKVLNGIWSVEDGAIVGRFDPQNPGPGYLLTEREFTDFELRLEFWVSKGGNSGVLLRMPHRNWSDLRSTGGQGERPTPGTRRRDPPGYEVNIDYDDPKNPTGSVYNVKRADKIVGGEDRWNVFNIECRGPNIRVRIDEELVTSYEAWRPTKGQIGLQIHGVDYIGGPPHTHVVKFRNIELVE